MKEKRRDFSIVSEMGEINDFNVFIFGSFHQKILLNSIF